VRSLVGRYLEHSRVYVFANGRGAGRPEHLIVELAENYGCDLIVLGAFGAGAAPDVVSGLGSVATAVLETSGVPVLLVRGYGEEAGDGDATA
jgi:nucleotide-binding universal stress UspA family protein